MKLPSSGVLLSWLALAAVLIGACEAANYKIDVILPTTGGTTTQNAMYAAAANAALQAATDVNNAWAAAGSTDTLTVTTKDSQYSGVQTINLALQSATDASPAHAVIGAGPSDLTVTTARLLKNYDTAVLSPFNGEPFDAELTNLYAMGSSIRLQVNLLQSLLNRYGWTKIGIAHTKEPESVSTMEMLSSMPGIELAAPPLVLPDSSETYLQDFDPFFNVSLNIYVFVVPKLSTLTNIIFQCQRNGGFFVGPKAFFYLNAPAGAMSVIPQGGLVLMPTSGTPSNVTAFTAKFGAQPTTGATEAYDAVMAVAKSIERGSTTRLQIMTDLANTNSNGFSGPLKFTNGYRDVKTFNVSNIFLSTPRLNRVAFTWNGRLAPAGPPVVWPGMASTPTLGNVTLWPVAFVSAMFDSTADMLANIHEIIPLNRTAHASFVRFAVKYVNDHYMPIDAKISTPPLNDNGTVTGAVRIGGTLGSDSYIAVVGTYGSDNTKILQGILSAYNVPQFAYHAGEPSLSDKVAYPTLVRVYQSDGKQVQAMIATIRHFGWTEVGVLSVTSAYGAIMDSAFTSALRSDDAGINQTKSTVFSEDHSDLQDQLKLLKDNRVHILALFCEPHHYGFVVKAMRAVDYVPRAVLVPNDLFSPSLWAHHLPHSGAVITDFKGWIGAVQAGGHGSPLFQNLTDEVLAANPLQYPSMKDAFLQYPDYCAYIFDSFLTIGDSIRRCLLQGFSPRSAPDLLNCVRATDTSMTTGRVAFDNSMDRLENHFVLKYLAADGVPTTFGTWNDGASGAESNLVVSRSVVWPDGTTTVPLAADPKDVRWLEWNSAAGIVLAVIAALGMLYVLVMVILMILWHESPILISATYPFLMLLLFGGALGFGSMFTWIGEPAGWICALRIWLPPMAFILMLAPLLAKTWRLHRIFSLRTLKTTPIPLWKLIVMVVCLSLIQVAICIAWISAGTIKVITIPDKNHATRAFRICEQNQANQICAYVTYGYLGVLMVIGAYYAFRVRKLPKDFNESRWIGFSIYNTLLFSIIIIILGYSLSDFKLTVLILICVCTLAITFGVTTLMMAPKIWDLILHPDRRSSSTGNNSGSPQGSRLNYSSTSYKETAPTRRHDYSRRSTKDTEMRTTNTNTSKNTSKGSRGSRSAAYESTEPRNGSKKIELSSSSS